MINVLTRFLYSRPQLLFYYAVYVRAKNIFSTPRELLPNETRCRRM